MKRKIYLSAVLSSLLLMLYGCGGSSGSASSSVSGTVNASKLAGVKVCVKNSTKCAVTDQNGYFDLQGVSAPVELELKVGDSVIKSFTASSASLTVTPSMLADNNATLAAYIGTFLHEAGDCNISQESCDLSNVTSLDVLSGTNAELVSEIEQQLSTNATLSFKVNGNDKNVSNDEAQLYMSFNPNMIGISSYSYSGAAAVGDFVRFKFDKNTNKLDYNISGNIYGDLNGSKTLKELYGGTFFTDQATQNDFYFFSGNLGVGVVPIPNQTNPAFLVGLQLPEETINENLIVNKEFNYIDFDNTGDITFSIVDINKSSDGSRTWTAYDFNGTDWESENGTWNIQADHINVLDSNGNKIANLIIKPGVNKAGFVIDNVNGGFGIGVEAKPLVASDINGTFAFYDDDFANDEGCFGDVVLNGASFTATEKYCIDSNGNMSASNHVENGTLTLNPTVGGRVLNGLADVNDTTGLSEYAFIDSVDGYFISVGFDTNGHAQFLSIGSNKGIK